SQFPPGASPVRNQIPGLSPTLTTLAGSPGRSVFFGGQVADRFARKRAEAIAASRFVRIDLPTHAWVPEASDVLGHPVDRSGVICLGNKKVADFVGHLGERFDSHAACSGG